MAELGVLEDYLTAGFGFDQLEIYIPSGAKVATIPAPKLTPEYPANVGIGRRALHKVSGRAGHGAGARIRLGVTARAIEDDGPWVTVGFSDGTTGKYAVVIGADGLYSETRRTIFPEAPAPEFTGQAVWRYNFKRPQNLISLHVFDGPMGIGLVPLSKTQMYMYVTTPEPGNPRYAKAGLAGRHTAGNNTFSYFLTPGGFSVEYASELERVDQSSWKPQVYTPSPSVMDQWGSGVGGPQAMPHAEPDKGLFRLPKSKAVALFHLLGGHTV